jgi:hypothetical protein
MSGISATAASAALRGRDTPVRAFQGRKGQSGADRIEVIRVRPVLTDTEDRFMLIGRP